MKKYNPISTEFSASFKNEDYKEDSFREEYQSGPSGEKAMFEDRPLPEERVQFEIRKQRQGMPRMEEQKIQPLNLLGDEVMGGLFDRVEFLRKRIEEISESLKIREQLHDDMVAEIEVDIKEKEVFASKVADIDEKRNFKLDISILRKEKRLESVQYWRDLVELKSELRELLEKHETETKIAAIFKGITGGEEV